MMDWLVFASLSILFIPDEITFMSGRRTEKKHGKQARKNKRKEDEMREVLHLIQFRLLLPASLFLSPTYFPSMKKSFLCVYSLSIANQT